jgi:peptidoglycan/LPS O-acetylase OafA/YrhL
MRRLHSLDTLRGVAALSIVIWHWQHFFAISGDWPDHWDRTSQPFFWVLKPLYDGGWAAVDLFFPLSGFVFFWLYSQAIRERRMGAGSFAWLRFSRLYPLHFAMLIAAAALQYFFWRQNGGFFVFSDNDWQHFLPSLLMAQQWLPPSVDQSFDGPAWSVSIEVLLYIVFFLLCRMGLRGPKGAAAVALLAIPLLLWNWFIARGLMGFFAGGVVFYLSERIKLRADARKISARIGIAALLLWIVVIAEDYLSPLHAALYWLSGHVSPLAGKLYIGESDNLFLLAFIFLVSPLTIMALALHEQVLGGVYKRTSHLGDISYSTYLLHFPIQIAVALWANAHDVPPAAFMNGYALLAFYAVLIGLGTLSYRYFERPMQNWLRGGLKRIAWL